MTTALVSIALAFAAGSAGWTEPGYADGGHTHPFAPGGRIVRDGPGYGWGFPNGNPDGYGWWDHGTALPLGANRTAEYYFPRYLTLVPQQMFLQSYYNPYVTRGQRYIVHSGCGGEHPAGGPPLGSAETPVNPYRETIGTGPRVRVPAFTGRVEVAPINSGATGLTP
jgi:hypothetical protein